MPRFWIINVPVTFVSIVDNNVTEEVRKGLGEEKEDRGLAQSAVVLEDQGLNTTR